MLSWACRCLEELVLRCLAGQTVRRRGLGRIPGVCSGLEQTEISGSCKSSRLLSC